MNQNTRCCQKKYNVVKTSADDNPKNNFSVNPSLTIAEINRDFRMRYLYFECEIQEEFLQELVAKVVEQTAEKATRQTVSALELMM